MKIKLYNGCTSGLSIEVDSIKWNNLLKKDKLSILLSMMNNIKESDLALYVEYLSYDLYPDFEEHYDCSQCGDSNRFVEFNIDEQL